MYQSSRCKVNFQDLFALLLTVRRSVLKVGRYKKWQKLTQDMPFSFSTKPTNQVFLLLEMYPDTSAYILKNPFFFLTQIRVHFPYYGSPIDVSCEMYLVPYTLVTLFLVHVFIRGDTKTSTKYDFSPHEIRAFFQGYFVSKYPLSLPTSL